MTRFQKTIDTAVTPTHTKPHNAVNLYAAQATTVPPQSIADVTTGWAVYIDKGFTGHIFGASDEMESPFAVQPCMVASCDMYHGADLHVTVVNPSPDPVVIDAGELIARLHVVADQPQQIRVVKTFPRSHRKQDPNAPKRGMTSFIVFSKKFRDIVKAEETERAREAGTEPDLGMPNISKLLGDRWRALSAEEQAPYITESERLKQQYRLEMDAYNARKAAEAMEAEKPAA
jgi:dUTPase